MLLILDKGSLSRGNTRAIAPKDGVLFIRRILHLLTFFFPRYTRLLHSAETRRLTNRQQTDRLIDMVIVGYDT